MSVLAACLTLLFPTASFAAQLSWQGKPGSNTNCDINAQANWTANGGGGRVFTSVGPIGAVGYGCERLRVTVNYYYAGQPRSASKTVDPRIATNDPSKIIAIIDFPGTYMNSSHCGLQLGRSTYGCHSLSS